VFFLRFGFTLEAWHLLAEHYDVMGAIMKWSKVRKLDMEPVMRWMAQWWHQVV
jgi:hypothetical protein